MRSITFIFGSKNVSQQPQPQSSQPQQHKSNKKPTTESKAKKTSDTKRSIPELIRAAQAKDVPTSGASTSVAHQQPTTSAATGNRVKDNAGRASLKASRSPIKVKSASWKRSEKQISTHGAITVKKLRKRSPSWLLSAPKKVNNKISGASDRTSVCRPGTLYSDVLFGAGSSTSSCLVKIKTLTPRRNGSAAQKKLTKALLKCGGSRSDTEQEAVSGSEPAEGFPSLNELPKSGSPPLLPTVVAPIDTDGLEKISGSKSSKSGAPPLLPTPVPAAATDIAEIVPEEISGSYTPKLNEQDVVILAPQTNFGEQSYGSYLENGFKAIKNIAACEQQRKSFVTIAPWNFLEVDITSADAFPRFLCQFDDEHYRNTEQMALAGLKLALGNSQNTKFKL